MLKASSSSHQSNNKVLNKPRSKSKQIRTKNAPFFSFAKKLVKIATTPTQQSTQQDNLKPKLPQIQRNYNPITSTQRLNTFLLKRGKPTALSYNDFAQFWQLLQLSQHLPPNKPVKPTTPFPIHSSSPFDSESNIDIGLNKIDDNVLVAEHPTTLAPATSLNELLEIYHSDFSPTRKNITTSLNNDSHWEWAHNNQSGLHPAYPFLLHETNQVKQNSHFYSRLGLTTPTAVNEKTLQRQYQKNNNDDALIGVHGIDFNHKSIYNRHMYRGGLIKYHSPLKVNQIGLIKQSPSISNEHIFSTSRKNRIDYDLAISNIHISHPPPPNHQFGTDFQLPSSIVHPSSLSSPQISKKLHSLPLHATIQQQSILYNSKLQSQIINTSPVPKVTQIEIPPDLLLPSAFESQFDRTHQQNNSDILQTDAVRGFLSEIRSDTHHVHFSYKITEDTINKWSKLSGNTNRLTLDEEYAINEGFPGRLVPLNLLTTLALDGLHSISQKIAPSKPMIMESIDELINETLFEGYMMGYLTQLQQTAFSLNQPVPESISTDQLTMLQYEFQQQQTQSSTIPPWHCSVQNIKSLLYEMTRPIYLPLASNLATNEISDENLSESTLSHKLAKKPYKPTVYLDFYAQVLKDELNHADYHDTISSKLNTALDLVDLLQNKYNPTNVNLNRQFENNSDEGQKKTIQASNASNDHVKRLTIRRNLDGKVYTPDDVMMQNNILYDSQVSKITHHQWDINNRIYLDPKHENIYEILDNVITFEDVLRNKPALIKLWITARYDDPFETPNNTHASNLAEKQCVDRSERCFLGFAIFDGPHIPPSESPHGQASSQPHDQNELKLTTNPTGYSIFTPAETFNAFAFAQGIELIEDQPKGADDDDDVGAAIHHDDRFTFLHSIPSSSLSFSPGTLFEDLIKYKTGHSFGIEDTAMPFSPGLYGSNIENRSKKSGEELVKTYQEDNPFYKLSQEQWKNKNKNSTHLNTASNIRTLSASSASSTAPTKIQQYKSKNARITNEDDIDSFFLPSHPVQTEQQSNHTSTASTTTHSFRQKNSTVHRG